MMCQSSNRWCVSGSGERGRNREWISFSKDYLLAVVGSRAGIEAPIWSNELSIKQVKTRVVAHDSTETDEADGMIKLVNLPGLGRDGEIEGHTQQQHVWAAGRDRMMLMMQAARWQSRCVSGLLWPADENTCYLKLQPQTMTGWNYGWACMRRENDRMVWLIN